MIMLDSVSPATLLQGQLRILRNNLVCVLDGDAHGVHDARIATRRIRELLPLVEDQKRRSAAKDVRGRFTQLGRVLGRVRDGDVRLALLGSLQARIAQAAPAVVIMRQQHERRRPDLMRELVKQLERLEIARLLCVLHDEHARRSRLVSWRTIDRRWRHDLRLALVARSRSAIEAIDHATGVYFPRRSHAARIAIKKLRYAMEIAQATRVAERGRAIRDLKKGQDLLGDLHDRQTLLDQLDKHELLGRQPGADRDVAIVKQVLEAECYQLHSEYLSRRTGLLAVCRAEQRGSLHNHRRYGSLLAAGAGAVSAAIYLARRPPRRTHVDWSADSILDDRSVTVIVETPQGEAVASADSHTRSPSKSHPHARC